MAINFITGSRDKFIELKTVIDSLEQIEMELPEIQELDAHKIIEAKLKEAITRVAGEYIVEDTSLYFDALGSLPGPLIKWFVKAIG
jgi:inosine/xanthosine triphosphate pyrophosphatase family protein